MRRPRPVEARRKALSFGATAEAVALVWLVLRGYRILARHYLAPGGEIDIVAMKGRTIAFVEVKARPDLDTAAVSITAEKRRRICRAASFWISRNRQAAAANLRGDALFIAPWRRPRHVEDAYPLEL
jgi:putative endonuclease